MGAKIVEAESDSEIKELGDFCPTPETQKLIPPVDYTKDLSDLPLLLVQLTRFKCGGISIGVAISHAVVDGNGAGAFISSWANFARGENKLVIEPYHDRTVFYKGDPLAKHGHKPKALPTLIGQNDAEEERKKECTNTMLKLSKSQVNKLKELANEGRDATSREYSRYEAIAAHIWRCASKARKLQNAQLTSLRISVDCRNRLKPSLPPVTTGYYGNAVIGTSPTAEVGKLLMVLGDGCGIIRQNVEKCNEDYIKLWIDNSASQEDLTLLRTVFHTDTKKGVFLGNPNITVTSWCGLPIYYADFGWGKPIFMGPAGLGFDGKLFLIPGSDEDGSFVIPIRLQVTHMDDFEKLFYKDI